MSSFRTALLCLVLGMLCSCGQTTQQPPLTINSPKLDSGIRGNGGGGLGGESVVGRSEGNAGVINRVRVP